jgi:hypothetical protein
VVLLLPLLACSPPEREFPTEANSLLDGFHRQSSPSAGAYDSLFRYFLVGWETYKLPEGAGAAYPGLAGKRGKVAERLEAFTRLAPMVAAWLSSGRPDSIQLWDGKSLELRAFLRTGVLAGTDPESPAYWGSIGDKDQRIVEAADVALALWLTRDKVWLGLTEEERARIGRWLSQVNGKRINDNNWNLLVAFTNVALHALRQPADTAQARRRYLRLKSFYRGDGWFSDGPSPAFDYYNAWGIHYTLHWLSRVDPGWDPAFIHEASALFLKKYRYLFGPGGFPIRGRSVCYRMALPAPLIAAQMARPVIIPADEARRALDVTWRYFIGRGAVRAGTVTQGYCGPDAEWLDNYSGPASCLWSLRSLVVAFAQRPSADLWTTRPGYTPVDTADVDMAIPAIGWRIAGRVGSGFVSIVNADSIFVPPSRIADRVVEGLKAILSRVHWLNVTAELIFQRPFRPENRAAKYNGAVYRGDRPFCGCKR